MTNIITVLVIFVCIYSFANCKLQSQFGRRIHNESVYFCSQPNSKVQANCKQENRKKTYTL